jgi:hypothetical protein
VGNVGDDEDEALEPPRDSKAVILDCRAAEGINLKGVDGCGGTNNQVLN